MSFPKIAGTWNYSYIGIRMEDPTKTNEKPPFAWKVVNNTQVIEQQDGFIRMSRSVTDTRLTDGWVVGAWVKRYTPFGNFWELNIADYDDNGRYTFTIKQSDKKGRPLMLEGSYVESGFSAINSSQKPTVQRVTLARLS